LPGTGVDEKLIVLAKKNSNPEIIQAIGNRQIAAAVDLLAKLASSSDTTVAKEALRSLAMAGTSKDVDVAVNILVNLKNESLRSEAENCLAEIIRSNDVKIKTVVTAIESAGDVKLQVSLVTALGKSGKGEAFDVLYDLITGAGKSDEVKKAAIAALSGSDNGNVTSYLIKAYKSLSNPEYKTLVYKGIVKTVPLNGGRDTQVKLDLFKKALSISSVKEEKQLVFSAVSRIQEPESLKFVMSYIDDSQLKDDAVSAAISISTRLSGTRRPAYRDAAKDAMKKVMDVSTDEKIKSKAKSIYDRIK